MNLTEADSMGAGPLSADISELMVDIETREGKTLAIDDPALIEMLCSEIDKKHQLTLMRSHRAMTDCRPVSIFSLQSARNCLKKQKLRSTSGVSEQTSIWIWPLITASAKTNLSAAH